MSPLEKATGVDKLTGEIVTERLTDAEAERCDELETRISKGMETFVEVGSALAAIRDEKLWRDRSTSFSNYLEFYWPDLKRAHAYRLMDAAETVAELSPMGDTPLPTSERQARALKPLSGQPEKQAEAMREASKDGPATAKKIEEAVEKIADPALKLRQEQEEARAKARAEKAALEKAAKEQAEQTMANRIADRRQNDPRVRAEHISQTVRGFLLSDAHTLLDINPAEAAESLAIGDEMSALADADRLAAWLADFRSHLTADNVTDLRSVK